MKRTYQYRLYPTTEQARRLRGWMEMTRRLWNFYRADRKQAWEERKESRSYYDDCKKLTDDRAQWPRIKDIPSNFGRGQLQNLHLAYQAFFRRYENGEDPGYPKPKTERNPVNSLVNRDAKGRQWVKDTDLHMPKMGRVDMVYHRPLPESFEVAMVVVKVVAGDKWYVSLSGDDGVPAPEKDEPRHAVGIDLGCTHIAVTSDGEMIDAPRYYRKKERKLHKLQRAADTKRSDRKYPPKKGSKNQQKRKRKIARAHHDVKNARKHFLHTLSDNLVNEYDIIVVEDLNIRGLSQKNGGGPWDDNQIHKSIADAGWGQLLWMLEYKAEERGKYFVKVNPRGTTQACSGCGKEVPKDLTERKHSCPRCGLELHRDVNSARVILQRGFDELGLCRAELTPAEMMVS